MKVDSQPFPQANVVELSDLGAEGSEFGISDQHGRTHPPPCQAEERCCFWQRPQDEHESEQQHVTEEQVRHIHNQLPASNQLLKKYQYQYKVRRRYELEEEEYEHRTGRTLGRRQAIRDH